MNGNGGAPTTPIGPPPDRDTAGWCATGRVRLRPGWLGVAVLEEEVEHLDGRREWHRRRQPALIAVAKEGQP